VSLSYDPLGNREYVPVGLILLATGTDPHVTTRAVQRSISISICVVRHNFSSHLTLRVFTRQENRRGCNGHFITVLLRRSSIVLVLPDLTR